MAARAARGGAVLVTGAGSGIGRAVVEALLAAGRPVWAGARRPGHLQALAVTSSRRATALPDTQTVAELGFPGFDFSTWVASALPKGAPAAMVARFNKAFVSALAFPEVQSTLLKQGAEPVGSTPEQLRDFIRAQIERSDLIVSRSGLRLD